MRSSDRPQTEALGGYRLVRSLGQGGMGEVWLAFDDRLQRLVALKRIRPEVAEDAQRRERFRREARLVARLHHRNVVQVFELVEAEEGDALVMEHVDGRSLFEALGDGPLSPRRAVEVATSVARGLEAAHRAGLVHRDLKSGNVLLSRDGEVKIVDFGLAKPLGPDPEATLTGERDLLGTAHAMAPEQILGEQVDGRTDLFALGGLIYEMLTGEPPFRAKSLGEVLRDILVRGPRVPLGEARPDLPPALLELVDELLAKVPDERPGSAARVVERLRAIAADLPPERGPERGSSALDERSTVLEAGARPALDELDGSRPPSGHRRRRAKAMPWVLGAGLPAALLALLFGWMLRSGWWPGAAAKTPLRVAVPRPNLAPDAADAWLATGVAVELQRGLLAFEGVLPLDPSQSAGLTGGPLDVARALSADEVLSAELSSENSLALVSLRRLRASDGGVLWAESVQVPAEPEGALRMANAVTAALRRAYPEQALRARAPDLEVRGVDYAAFLRVVERVDHGATDLEPDLRRLEQIALTSPRFIDAHVMAAQIALSLHRDAKNAGFLARAAAAVERGRAFMPDYPPLVAARIRLALAAGDHATAEQELAHLESVQPGDPQIPYSRARLAESRGRLDEAIAILRRAVARRATWRQLVYLADYEYRGGEIEAARRHLEAALELAPDNPWPLAKLARLELFYGDLERAGEIYEKRIAAGGHRSDLVNLGLVRYLLGDYDAAAASYRRALEQGGHHVAITLNLADAELARGYQEAARELYGRALAALEELERTAQLRPAERTAKAQCLIRLGHEQEALEVVIDAVRKHPDEAEVLYQAALVYALAGEEGSAVAYARQALELGYQPRWLTIPGFKSLRDRPDFERLLEDSRQP